MGRPAVTPLNTLLLPVVVVVVMGLVAAVGLAGTEQPRLLFLVEQP